MFTEPQKKEKEQCSQRAETEEVGKVVAEFIQGKSKQSLDLEAKSRMKALF